MIKRRYNLVFMFSKDLKEVLMIYKYWGPYPDQFNGVGGKIEDGETLIESAIRECEEETGKKLILDEIDYLLSITFHNNVELNVFYAVVDKFEPIECNEGIFEWKPIEFTLDFNNPMLAGDGNISYFIRESLNMIKMC